MILLILAVCLLVMRIMLSVDRYAASYQISLEHDLIATQRELQLCHARKAQMEQDKEGLRADAQRIFTLYEITREITKVLHENEAFEIFKKKLKEHVYYQSCQMKDPHAQVIEGENEDRIVFTLQGKDRKIGYLEVSGAAKEDKDKIMILGHQFALALRRVKLYEEIEKIAITDSLTELFTRRHTEERFSEELKRAKARKVKLSFLMIDVDHFKKFNDTYGHLAGDQILREIARIVKESIREIDIAGRYGGEEFCVILPDTDGIGALNAAERIRSATQDALIKAYDANIKATVSIGVATYPEDGEKLPEMIDKADWALYRAKKEGRNRTCVFGNYKEK